MGTEGAATGVSGAGSVVASCLAANAATVQVAGIQRAALLPNAGNGGAFRGSASAFIPVQHIPMTSLRTPVPTLWSPRSRSTEALSGMALMGMSSFPDMMPDMEPGYQDPTIAAVGSASMMAVMGGIILAATWQDIKAYFKKSFLFRAAPVSTEKAAAEAPEAARPQAGFQRAKHTLRDIEPRGLSIPPPSEEKPKPGVKY